jgi:antitoxin component of MazEF toxin-antitoxin module
VSIHMHVRARKFGDNFIIPIPSKVAMKMRLSQGMILDVTHAGSTIVVRKRSRANRRSLKSLLNQIRAGSYKKIRALLQDARVGAEYW